MILHCCRYLSLLILILAGGCADEVLRVEDELPIIPLAVGNQWVWNYASFDSTSQLLESEQNTLRILGDTTINGEQWYIPDRNYYVINRPDGNWSARKSDPLNGELDFKHPLIIGETFHSHTVSYGPGLKEYHIYDYVLKEMGEPISVLAGQFAANRYELEIRNPDGSPAPDNDCKCRATEWFAPGIGLIKAEYYQRTVTGLEYLNLSIELVDVVLK